MESRDLVMCQHLSERKKQLLNRLSRSGEILVTPVVQDEFTQMSEPECRSFVQNVERYLKNFIAQVT
jgi:hypothetical protein